MGGATSVMPVIRDAFSQQAADTTQWADTINERYAVIGCKLRVHAQYCTCASVAGLVVSFIVVVMIAFSCNC